MIHNILLPGTVSLDNALRKRKPHGHALQAVGTCIQTSYVTTCNSLLIGYVYSTGTRSVTV